MDIHNLAEKTEVVTFHAECGYCVSWAVINTKNDYPVVGQPVITQNEPEESDIKEAYHSSLLELIKLEKYLEVQPENCTHDSDKMYEV